MVPIYYSQLCETLKIICSKGYNQMSIVASIRKSGHKACKEKLLRKISWFSSQLSLTPYLNL